MYLIGLWRPLLLLSSCKALLLLLLLLSLLVSSRIHISLIVQVQLAIIGSSYYTRLTFAAVCTDIGAIFNHNFIVFFFRNKLYVKDIFVYILTRFVTEHWLQTTFCLKKIKENVESNREELIFNGLSACRKRWGDVR